MRATVHWFRLSVVMSFLFLEATFAAGQTSKPLEIPAEAEVKAAVDTLREVYDKEYIAAEKDAKAKKALAQKLFDTAPKRKTSAMVFACYEEARRLAAAGGEGKSS